MDSVSPSIPQMARRVVKTPSVRVIHATEGCALLSSETAVVETTRQRSVLCQIHVLPECACPTIGKMALRVGSRLSAVSVSVRMDSACPSRRQMGRHALAVAPVCQQHVMQVRV